VHFVELPGRRGPTADSGRISPREVAEAVAAHADGRYALYGHSMGARIAFEVTRELSRLGVPLPVRLYVGAAHPPHLPEPIARLVNVTEDEFIDQLIRRAGAPEAMRDEPDVRAALMPALRADLRWLQQYRYRPGSLLPTPVVAFAGSDDREVSPDEMLGWARHTSGSFRLHTVTGDHMFISTAGDTVTSLIADDLAATATAGAARLPMPDTDEIHVWRAALDRMPGACAATGELSAREEARAAAYHQETDRRRYIGRCVLLRRLLRRYEGDPDPAGPDGLRFSLGHSGGTVLLAFSRGHEIGVDVKRVHPMADFAGALTPAEQAEVAAEPEELQLRSGLRFSTAKDALLEAAGGPRTEPSQLSFAGQPPGALWRADQADDLRRFSGWRVGHLELEGAVAAVAIRRDSWRLRFETLVER
jgi:surfactin synthase thioesterase subunit/phosphopantetheinyl transferase